MNTTIQKCLKLYKTLVFIDPAVEDYQTLLEGIVPEAKAIALDASRDGVEQITEILQESTCLETIHLVSHGSPGCLYLGSTQLNLKTLERYISQLQSWSSALVSGGQGGIFLYGCNVAAGKDGATFVQRLQQTTGVPIAASANRTGSAALGGDWKLEVTTGKLEFNLPFNAGAVASYASVLATFTVTNTSDSGAGSLRQAILDANATPDTDAIAFNIGGGGVQTIAPLSPLPTITSPVVIDGTTQPGFTGTPIIELNGTNAGFGAEGLDISAGNSTIRGLVINRFRGTGIRLSGKGGNLIVDNYIGTDVTGTVALGNSEGVSIEDVPNNTIENNVISGNSNIAPGVNIGIIGGNASGNRVIGNFIGTNATGTAVLNNPQFGIGIGSGPKNIIGGTTPEERNIISGHSNAIVILVTPVFPNISSGEPNENQIIGNYIGTDITGTVALGNEVGMVVGAGSNTLIGGVSAGAGNVISGNQVGIIIIEPSTNNRVIGNFIGTQADGSSPLGNAILGVAVDAPDTNHIIGGTAPGEGNVIAFNGNSGGVYVVDNSSVGILGNRIFANVGLGIDLDPTPVTDIPDGVTPNDVGDVDSGPNNLQNFPIIASAISDGTNTTVSGTLNSTANTTFRVEFFANSALDPTSFGEGEQFLGFTTVTTDASGNVSFTETIPTGVPVGQLITATVTDSDNNTSEFSAGVAVATLPGVSITQTDGSTEVSEDGGTDSYQIALNTVPTGAVTLEVAIADEQTQVSLDGVNFANSVSFTRSDTSPQTIFVQAADDATVETSPQTGIINHQITATEDSANYPTTLAIKPANVSITDNDTDDGGGGGTLSLTAIANQIFRLEGNPGQAQLLFSQIERDASFVNEIGVFVVDDDQGTITDPLTGNAIAPGQANYLQAALSQGQVIFSAMADQIFPQLSAVRQLSFNTGDPLQFYLVQDGTTDQVLADLEAGRTPTKVFFATTSANTDNFNPLQIANQGNNKFELAWKDQFGRGDTDFNDMRLTLELTDQSPTLGTNLQGKRELIDLRGQLVATVPTQFILNSEAAFSNSFGFYAIDDITGSVRGINPNEAGYAARAIAQQVDLSEGLPGGALLAPFIVANGTVEEFLAQNPDNQEGGDVLAYFAFGQANPDRRDHVRLLGDNIFGFEDRLGGGDNDFNDLVVEAQFS
jgi:hypothetical protein